jgi:hypothetical protein
MHLWYLIRPNDYAVTTRANDDEVAQKICWQLPYVTQPQCSSDEVHCTLDTCSNLVPTINSFISSTHTSRVPFRFITICLAMIKIITPNKMQLWPIFTQCYTLKEMKVVLTALNAIARLQRYLSVNSDPAMGFPDTLQAAPMK